MKSSNLNLPWAIWGFYNRTSLCISPSCRLIEVSVQLNEAWVQSDMFVCLSVSRCVSVSATACLCESVWRRIVSSPLWPVGDVEACQVVGSITEEVQQGETGLRHHLRNRLVPVTLRDDQTAGKTQHRSPFIHISLLKFNHEASTNTRSVAAQQGFKFLLKHLQLHEDELQF